MQRDIIKMPADKSENAVVQVQASFPKEDPEREVKAAIHQQIKKLYPSARKKYTKDQADVLVNDTWQKMYHKFATGEEHFILFEKNDCQVLKSPCRIEKENSIKPLPLTVQKFVCSHEEKQNLTTSIPGAVEVPNKKNTSINVALKPVIIKPDFPEHANFHCLFLPDAKNYKMEVSEYPDGTSLEIKTGNYEAYVRRVMNNIYIDTKTFRVRKKGQKDQRVSKAEREDQAFNERKEKLGDKIQFKRNNKTETFRLDDYCQIHGLEDKDEVKRDLKEAQTFYTEKMDKKLAKALDLYSNRLANINEKDRSVSIYEEIASELNEQERELNGPNAEIVTAGTLRKRVYKARIIMAEQFPELATKLNSGIRK